MFIAGSEPYRGGEEEGEGGSQRKDQVPQSITFETNKLTVPITLILAPETADPLSDVDMLSLLKPLNIEAELPLVTAQKNNIIIRSFCYF